MLIKFKTFVTMCGIICEICYTGPLVTTQDTELMQRIRNRGPDCIHHVTVNINDAVSAYFCGAVLWMQGQQPTAQPVENHSGVLLYNGDIFNESWNKNTSDTQIIMEKLTESMNQSSEQVIKELKLLKGPFSIIFYDKLSQNLYFARDRIGRNTLLFHKNENTIIISSVLGRKYQCIEVPATYIHKFNVNTHKIELHFWSNEASLEYDIKDWFNVIQKQQSLLDEEFSCDFDTLNLNEDDDVRKYIHDIAQEKQNKLTVMNQLLEHTKIEETVSQITALLEKSIKIRLETQPNKCKDCLYNTEACIHCTVGILFSGGLDCTILAFLANKYTPKEQSIELLNVAFKKDENASYDVPDRLTGRQSYQELKKLCPLRKWMFREINVPKDQLQECQRNTIADLVYPRKTILDESLGSALWFAAKGKNENKASVCRVLLIGSGADELFGGYTRHRNAFRRQGWSGLSKELQLDWNRISFRNLARDNRVTCDHGRQPRMPYLDEDFTNFVLQLKPWLKCYPNDTLGPGIGDKLILRLVAFRLGLKEVAILPKRALQFGSRIANKREKGCELSKNFVNM